MYMCIKFFTHTLHSKHNFLCLHSFQSPLPPSLSPRSIPPLFPFQKPSPGISTESEHGLTLYTWTVQKLVSHSWKWQSSRNKRVPSIGKRVGNSPHCWKSHRNTKSYNHKVYAEDQLRPMQGPYFLFCELLPMSHAQLYSVDCVLMVSLTPLASTILPHPLLWAHSHFPGPCPCDLNSISL